MADALLSALRAIANGTPDNPIKANPAQELARIDLIAMEAIAAHEAAQAEADPDDNPARLHRCIHPKCGGEE